jgi:peptide/nickel transport system substrate-binding protein
MSGSTTRLATRLVAVLGLLLALGLAAGPAAAQKKTLVVALNQDPDVLDPSLARTYVGRIVFASICEKLYEIDETLNIYPQLAAELPRFTDGGKTVTIKLRPGVKFNDGTPMNAEAVILYLYHRNYIVAFPKNLKGYKPVPDGLVRLKGVSWN